VSARARTHTHTHTHTQDWNSPLYTAKLIKANKVPFRYSQSDDLVKCVLCGKMCSLW